MKNSTSVRYFSVICSLLFLLAMSNYAYANNNAYTQIPCKIQDTGPGERVLERFTIRMGKPNFYKGRNAWWANAIIPNNSLLVTKKNVRPPHVISYAGGMYTISSESTGFYREFERDRNKKWFNWTEDEIIECAF